MGIPVESFDELSVSDTQAVITEVSQLLQERHPTVELSRGVIYDLVATVAGELSAARRLEITRLQQSMSLSAIEANPTLADDDIVDAVLANFLVTRRAGVGATGSALIVVATNTSVVIPVGTPFVANGVTFIPNAAYIGRPTGSAATTSAERILQPLQDGNYGFTIDLTATTAGEAGNILQGTKLIPSAAPSTFVTAYASRDFSGGTDTELNSDLVQRLQEGIAAKSIGGRTNYTALIRSQQEFENISAISVIGFGDEEMLRDQHSILPISYGGRVDIYMRYHQYATTTLTKTATLVQITEDGGIWQISLTRDEAAACYEIEKVHLPSADSSLAGYAITEDVRNYYIDADDEFSPDIATAEEAAYTKYQTITFRFLDTDTSTGTLTAGVSTQDYTVVLATTNDVVAVQDFLSQRTLRNAAGDVLVHGAVPCWLGVTVTVQKSTDDPTPDTEAMQLAIADRINALGFVGKLHASRIIDAAHEFLEGQAAISLVDMLGVIRAVDGTKLYVHDTRVLTIPSRPDIGVTGRTTAFFILPEDVTIEVNSVDFADIV